MNERKLCGLKTAGSLFLFPSGVFVYIFQRRDWRRCRGLFVAALPSVNLEDKTFFFSSRMPWEVFFVAHMH